MTKWICLERDQDHARLLMRVMVVEMDVKSPYQHWNVSIENIFEWL